MSRTAELVLNSAYGLTAAVWKHVKIGDIELGVRQEQAPDTSKPNPTEIVWKQDFVIVKQKITGMKPLTQCTEPDGLWYCDITFTTLDNRDEVLQKVVDMNAGPWRIETYLMTKCMFIESKVITQVNSTKDWYQKVQLGLCECNTGK